MACADETGIVVQVAAADPELVVEELDLYVGVADHLGVDSYGVEECNAPNGVHRYVEVSRDGDVPADVDRVVDVRERNLRSDPYRLLLRPGAELPEDAAIMVIVVARAGDQPVAVADLPEDAYFKPGALRQWEITLDRERVDLAGGNGCVCTATGVITPVDNQDCDATYGDDDCEPRNPVVDPRRGEQCDGLGDNDCDRERRPYEGLLGCYGASEESCSYGQRPCLDTAGSFEGAHDGECVVSLAENDLAPPELCARFAGDCRSDSNAGEDPFECANAPHITRLQCVARLSPNGTLCPGHTVRLIPLFESPAECRWALFGGVEQAHYLARLLADPDEVPGDTAVVNGCTALLQVPSTAGDVSRPYDDRFLLLFQRQEADQPNFELLQLDVEVERGDRCPANAEQKPGFSCEGLDNVEVDEAP